MTTVRLRVVFNEKLNSVILSTTLTSSKICQKYRKTLANTYNPVTFKLTIVVYSINVWKHEKLANVLLYIDLSGLPNVPLKYLF